MKIKIKHVLLAIAVTFILAAITGIIIKATSNYELTQNFVYAKTEIPALTVITQDMLEYKNKPLSDGHSLALKNINEVIGKVTKVDISKDELILTTRLSDISEVTDKLRLNDKNNRKFTVEFKPDQAVGWQIKSNQYADIIFIPNETVSANNIQTEPHKQSTQIYNKSTIKRLNNIRIVCLIDEAGKLVEENSQSMPKYICFEVTTEQDQFLAWAKSNGRIEISAIQDSKLR